MNKTALVAHPYPIVVDALAAMVAAAGFSVIRVNDAAGLAAGYAAQPAFALVAAMFDGPATDAAVGPSVVIADDDTGDDGIALTAPIERIAATIVTLAGEHSGASAGPVLTPRERDVARLVAAGQRNRAIGSALGISEGTVKMHLHNVYTKMGLQSRTQLAMATRALVA